MPHSANRLLSALPQNELAQLRPILVSDSLSPQQVLFEPRTRIETVYFPTYSVISLVVPLSDGGNVEGATVGHDGVVGAGAVLNGGWALSRAVVQLEGACQQCSIEILKAKLGACPVLAGLLARYEQFLLAQAQQSAACNATHNLNSRLARWLLRARDLRGSDELKLTQDHLAQMLGVGRTSVSIVAHTLQQTGVLRYRRGHIWINDVEALKEMSCECYEAVKLHNDMLRSTQAAG